MQRAASGRPGAAVLYFYAARHIQFDEPMDGIVYGATASLGFATLENVLYVSDGGLHVAILRAFLAVPGHAFLGAIMGYYVSRAKFTGGDRRPLLVRALAIPILLHGLYDTPLLAGDCSGGDASDPGCLVLALLPLVPAIVVGEAIWAVRLVRRLRAEQLAAGCPPPPPAPAAVTPVVVAAPGTAAAAPPVSAPGKPRRPGRWASWLLVLLGGVIACGGALVTLGLLLALAEGGSSPGDRLYDVIAGVVLGLLPLAAGTFGFFWGIARLNRNR